MALLVIALLFGCRHKEQPASVQAGIAQGIDTVPMLIMQVQQCSKLYTAEYRVHKIITHDDALRFKGQVMSKSFNLKVPLADRKIAIPMDALAIAMSELASISERRTYRLIHGQRDLPKFLVANPGLNSGFMIPQYTAAAIVSQNKGLCWPASCDSIPSSQGQEDHVSMGANSATKLVRVVDNTERVLAIELFNAAQALDFRHPVKSSPLIEGIWSDYRKEVPFIENDVCMAPLIEKSVLFIRNEQYL